MIDVDDRDARRARELAQLLERVLEVVGAAPAGDRDEDRALAGADLVHRRRARELLLEGADPVLEVEVELRRAAAARAAGCPRPSRLAGSSAAMCARPGRPSSSAATLTIASSRSFARSVRSSCVSPSSREVRVDAAQAAQAAAAGAHAAPVRQLDRAVVADHHVGDRAARGRRARPPARRISRESSVSCRAKSWVTSRFGGRRRSARRSSCLTWLGLQAVGVAEDADSRAPAPGACGRVGIARRGAGLPNPMAGGAPPQRMVPAGQGGRPSSRQRFSFLRVHPQGYRLASRRCRLRADARSGDAR